MDHIVLKICLIVLVSFEMTDSQYFTPTSSAGEVYINATSCYYWNGSVYENGIARSATEQDRMLIGNYKMQYANYQMEYQRYLNLRHKMLSSTPMPTTPQMPYQSSPIAEEPEEMETGSPGDKMSTRQPFDNAPTDESSQFAEEPAEVETASPDYEMPPAQFGNVPADESSQLAEEPVEMGIANPNDGMHDPLSQFAEESVETETANPNDGSPSQIPEDGSNQLQPPTPPPVGKETTSQPGLSPISLNPIFGIWNERETRISEFGNTDNPDANAKKWSTWI